MTSTLHSPRLQDVILFSHTHQWAEVAHRVVEELGSLYGKTYEVLPQATATGFTQLSFKHGPSLWKALALLIQCTVALPFTVIAILAKWLLRRSYTLQIKPRPLPVAPLPVVPVIGHLLQPTQQIPSGSRK